MKHHKSNSKTDRRILSIAVILMLVGSLVVPLTAITEAQSNSSSLSPEKTIHGVSIPVSDEVEQQFLQDTQGLVAERPNHAFFVATEESIFVIFSDREPTAGLVSVTGRVVGDILQSDRTDTVSVMSAQSVEFDTSGEHVSLRELNRNPERYSLDLVQTSGFHHQAAVRFDPDTGRNQTQPFVVGELSAKSPSPLSHFHLIEETRTASIELSQENEEAALSKGKRAENHIRTVLQPDPKITTFSTSEEFWSASNQTVTGILIAEDTPAMRALRMSEQSDMSPQVGNSTLYIIDNKVVNQSGNSIQEISHNIPETEGREVGINASFSGAKISVQESLEHNTPACGPDRAEVPSPSGPVCQNLMMDTVVYFGVAWEDTPDSREDVLPVIGISNEHMDSPRKSIQGEYRLTGRVMDTSDISYKLPSGPALVAYDMEKTDTISSVDSSVVTNEHERLNTTILAQLQNKTVPESVGDTTNTETQQQTTSSVSESESNQRNNREETTQEESPLSDIHPVFGYLFLGLLWLGIPVALAYSFVEFSGWLWIRLVKFALWLRSHIL